MRKTLVTTALTYANGPLHLGHLVEQIQADIWVRVKRMNNQECIFISGDDAHGTPIMLSDAKQNITPLEMIKKIHQEHEKDSADFLVEFDNYDTTHNDVNKEIVYDIYNKLSDKGLIYTQKIDQAYDEEAKMFLPDRFIKGSCPKCGVKDQYGDNCEACGATYTPVELIEPYSTISNTTPITRESEHYFFKLSSLQNDISNWLGESPLQNPVRNKLKEWLNESLRDWDISRDSPYFGFTIPNTTDKYFYVWLDAPIGYLGSLKNYSNKNPNINYEDMISPSSNVDMYHFIGKDITYFHGLFWPAMLQSSGYKTPTAIYAHGFLTVNGEKMSKSRGTFITARDYLNKYNPEFFRYYLATRLSDGVEDIDLNWDEFANKINSDLIGKVVNIASRTAGFIHKKYSGRLSDELDNEQLIKDILSEKDNIIKLYESRKYQAVTTKIMQLADNANQYIAQAEPWKKIKETQHEEDVHRICTTAINAFKAIIIYLAPILPKTAKNVAEFLQISELNWQELDNILLSHEIKKYTHLIQRFEQKT